MKVRTKKKIDQKMGILKEGSVREVTEHIMIKMVKTQGTGVEAEVKVEREKLTMEVVEVTSKIIIRSKTGREMITIP